MNPTNATTPVTRATATGTVKPLPIWINPNVVEARATVMRAAPRRSGLGADMPSEVSGTWRKAIHAVTVAMGRLMKNTGRHDRPSTSQPPTKGPTAPAAAPSPDQAPTALARSSGWNDAEMMARLLGTRRAAAAPWTA